MIRTKPIPSEFPSLAGTALENSMKRCYSCGMIFIKGRTINSALYLYICNECDGTKEDSVKQTSITRTTHVDPKDAICHVCKKELINKKRMEKAIKKKTASGALSELDKERIEKQIKNIGWMYLGNNKYVHTRCK